MLHESLTAKFNKQELPELFVFGQTAKLFRSKEKLESTVVDYMKQLSTSRQLLAQPDVVSFLKHNAFDIRWKDGEDSS